MKFRYSISYFIVITSIVIFYIFAFSINSTYHMNQYAKLEEGNDIVINSNSDDVISEGYYLMENEGYVIVYLFDKITLFEETDISISSLDKTLQFEIENGKYLKNQEELYGFLENYSS